MKRSEVLLVTESTEVFEGKQRLEAVVELHAALTGTAKALEILKARIQEVEDNKENVLQPGEGKHFLVAARPATQRTFYLKGEFDGRGQWDARPGINHPVLVPLEEGEVFEAKYLVATHDRILAIGLDGITCQSVEDFDEISLRDDSFLEASQ